MKNTQLNISNRAVLLGKEAHLYIDGEKVKVIKERGKHTLDLAPGEHFIQLAYENEDKKSYLGSPVYKINVQQDTALDYNIKFFKGIIFFVILLLIEAVLIVASFPMWMFLAVTLVLLAGIVYFNYYKKSSLLRLEGEGLEIVENSEYDVFSKMNKTAQAS